MGYDSFGLPAEQYAIKTNNHPGKFTEENIKHFTQQLKHLVVKTVNFSTVLATLKSTKAPSLLPIQFLCISLVDSPLIKKITTKEHLEEVNKYILEASKKSELERTSLSKEKTGCFSLLPIQFLCISLVDSGQSILFKPSSKASPKLA